MRGTRGAFRGMRLAPSLSPMSPFACRGLGAFRDGRARVWGALLLSVSLALASRSEAAVALVKPIGTNSNEASGTSITIATPAGGVAVGNTVIVTFAMDPAAGAVSCADAKGNAYTK